MIGPYFLLHHLTLAFALLPPVPLPSSRILGAASNKKARNATRKIHHLTYVTKCLKSLTAVHVPPTGCRSVLGND
jgi:hypothetical protein